MKSKDQCTLHRTNESQGLWGPGLIKGSLCLWCFQTSDEGKGEKGMLPSSYDDWLSLQKAWRGFWSCLPLQVRREEVRTELRSYAEQQAKQ
jgi:hypothetical protein